MNFRLAMQTYPDEFFMYGVTLVVLCCAAFYFYNKLKQEEAKK